MVLQEPVIELGKQRKSKAPIVATICAILALAGIGFGVYGLMQNSNKNIDNLKIEIENSDGTKTELETDKISISNDNSTITIKDGKVGDYTVYRYLVDRYVLASGFFNRDTVVKALEGDFNNANYEALVTIGSPAGEAIAPAELKEGVKKYFGKDSFDYDTFSLGCIEYKLDNRYYRSYAGGCGSPARVWSVYSIDKVEEKDKVLSVEISYASAIDGPENDSCFVSLGGDIYKENIDCNEAGAEVAKEKAEKYFYEHSDEFDHYTLTFKKGDRNYYLTGMGKAE